MSSSECSKESLPTIRPSSETCFLCLNRWIPRSAFNLYLHWHTLNSPVPSLTFPTLRKISAIFSGSGHCLMCMGISTPFTHEFPSLHTISAAIRMGHKHQMSKLVDHALNYLMDFLHRGRGRSGARRWLRHSWVRDMPCHRRGEHYPPRRRILNAPYCAPGMLHAR
ncbi:hypothetical protein BV20DRAFT_48307 [Pilatotrama ljubarskyi]|nr:hypothetical protein BV20DRAFT_48307 [Pilatotrama ljubarskyi]